MTTMLESTKDLKAAVITMLTEVNAKWRWYQMEIQILKKQYRNS